MCVCVLRACSVRDDSSWRPLTPSTKFVSKHDDVLTGITSPHTPSRPATQWAEIEPQESERKLDKGPSVFRNANTH